MKKFILLILVFASYHIVAQDTIYCNKDHKKSNRFNFEAYLVSSSKSSKNGPHYERIYYKNNVLRTETLYKTNRKKRHLKYRYWYQSGQLRTIVNYKKGKRVNLLVYWENEKLKRKDNYKKGKFINGTCWDKNGVEIPYFPFEISATFQGKKNGVITYIKKEFKSFKKHNGLKAIIRFKVNTIGKVTNISFLKRTENINLDVKIVNFFSNMPKWEPAKQDGKPVTVSFTIPLSF